MASHRRLETINAELAVASPALFEATAPPSLSADDLNDYLGFRLRAVSGSAGVSTLRTQYGDPLLILLVTSQVALSLLLLFGALVFAGTLRNLLAVDVGFDRTPSGSHASIFPGCSLARTAGRR